MKSLKRSEGYLIASAVIVLLGIAILATIYRTQASQEVSALTGAVATASEEEARALEILNKAAHRWADDEYNRARVSEYDTRYEIDQVGELIANNYLPPEFANRYSEIGESVYGLLYATSIIRRQGPDDTIRADDEFYIMTTIDSRGVFPPPPPDVCPYMLTINGHSDLNLTTPTHVLTNMPDEDIAFFGDCSAQSEADHLANLEANSANLNVTIGTPAFISSLNISCSMVNSVPPADVIEEIYPYPATAYMNCVGNVPPAAANVCPYVFSVADHTSPILRLPQHVSTQSSNNIPRSVNCSAMAPALHAATLKNNSQDLNHNFGNQAYIDSLSIMCYESGDVPNNVLSDISPATAESYMSCVGSSAPVILPDCPVTYRHTDENSVNILPETEVRSYTETVCSTSLSNTNQNDLQAAAINNSTVYGTGGPIDFSLYDVPPSQPTCYVSGAASPYQKIRCSSVALGSGGSGTCPVAFEWMVNAAGMPQPNPFRLSSVIKEYNQNCSATLASTAQIAVRTDSGLNRSTSVVNWDGDNPVCAVEGSGNVINCRLHQTDSGGPGNEECVVWVYRNGNSYEEWRREYTGTNCLGNTN